MEILQAKFQKILTKTYIYKGDENFPNSMYNHLLPVKYTYNFFTVEEIFTKKRVPLKLNYKDLKYSTIESKFQMNNSFLGISVQWNQHGGSHLHDSCSGKDSGIEG